MFTSFLDFIFPNTCMQCSQILAPKAHTFCIKCYMDLPFTHWKWNHKNEMYEKLFPFVPIENANSLFYFRKRSSIQKVLHGIKYRQRTDMAKWLVSEWIERTHLDQDDSLEMICPVPIHKQKLRERGYHQNALLGEALAQALAIPYEENVLGRIRHQSSQALMHRQERLNRLEDTFTDLKIPEDKSHFLLIDDICTTGATLMHCAKILVDKGKKVSILTLAYAV